MKKLAIIMPVYNEQDIIKEVINEWKNVLTKKEFDLVVVNDGSKDKTNFILNTLKKKNNHIKLLNKQNSGHGDSILFGYKYAVSKNYQFIFQVDSDHQFRSADFNKLWKIKNKDYDIILGYRKIRKDPIIRIFLSKIILKLFFIIIFQKNILDANTPYRLIKRNFLRTFIFKYCHNKKYLAPNILMCLLSKKIISINVEHFKRATGSFKWSLKKIIYFGIKLIFEMFIFKKNIILNKSFKLKQ
jgi:dolichol-phosphate mannosyltransferase